MNFDILYNNYDEKTKETYPKIENVKKDIRFGRMLYDSFAGPDSELTTILQYINENISDNTSQELKHILLGIAIEEMGHLKIIGELLVALGCIPYYMSSRNNKWCSDKVKYNFNCINDMLKYNIEGEKIAIKEYKRLIENNKNECIINILKRIIKDEENHIKIFTALLTKK